MFYSLKNSDGETSTDYDLVITPESIDQAVSIVQSRPETGVRHDLKFHVVSASNLQMLFEHGASSLGLDVNKSSESTPSRRSRNVPRLVSQLESLSMSDSKPCDILCSITGTKRIFHPGRGSSFHCAKYMSEKYNILPDWTPALKVEYGDLNGQSIDQRGGFVAGVAEATVELLSGIQSEWQSAIALNTAG